MNNYGYEFINLYNAARRPSTVHCTNTALVNYYADYLLQKAMAVFKFEGLPDYWAANYFKYVLFGYGFIAVMNTDKYGVIPQECGLSDTRTVFYQPKYAIINNPVFDKTYMLTIGQDCEVIKLQPNYKSCMDIVYLYADQLALCTETAGINLLNSKLSYIFFAKDKAQAETFKKTYDKLASGNPMAVIDSKLKDVDGSPNWQLFFQNVGQNYIADKVLGDMKKIEDRFKTVIGIPNANTFKKERLIRDEVNANNFDTESNVLIWLENMQADIAKVNKMFDLNISVSYRYASDYSEEVTVNE